MLDNKISFESSLKGKTYIIVRDARHATVSFDGVQVNRTEQGGNFHLVLLNGIWQLWNSSKEGNQAAVTPYERHQAAYFRSKWDGKKFVETSTATRNKVIDVLLPAAVKVLQENQAVLVEAEQARICKAIAEAVKEIGELDERIAVLRAKVTSLREEFNQCN